MHYPTHAMHPMGQTYPAMQPMPDAKTVCMRFMNFYVIGQMHDGTQLEGIIEDMDDDHVTMLVPEDVDESEIYGNRQWMYGGYGGYGGYGRRRFRRFRRRRFPFRFFVYPFFFPFPFYY